MAARRSCAVASRRFYEAILARYRRPARSAYGFPQMVFNKNAIGGRFSLHVTGSLRISLRFLLEVLLRNTPAFVTRSPGVALAGQPGHPEKKYFYAGVTSIPGSTAGPVAHRPGRIPSVNTSPGKPGDMRPFSRPAVIAISRSLMSFFTRPAGPRATLSAQGPPGQRLPDINNTLPDNISRVPGPLSHDGSLPRAFDAVRQAGACSYAYFLSEYFFNGVSILDQNNSLNFHGTTARTLSFLMAGELPVRRGAGQTSSPAFTANALARHGVGLPSRPGMAITAITPYTGPPMPGARSGISGHPPPVKGTAMSRPDAMARPLMARAGLTGPYRAPAWAEDRSGGPGGNAVAQADWQATGKMQGTIRPAASIRAGTPDLHYRDGQAVRQEIESIKRRVEETRKSVEEKITITERARGEDLKRMLNVDRISDHVYGMIERRIREERERRGA